MDANLSNRGSIKLVMGIIAGFLLIAGLLLISTYYPLCQEAESSMNWPETIGTVAFRKVVRATAKGNSQVAWVYIRFVLDRVRYTVGQNLGVYSSTEQANAVIEKYPLNQRLAVFYDPKNPPHAVLLRGQNLQNMRGMFYGGITCLALGAILGILIAVSKSTENSPK